ncbi:MAG: type II secretion system protein [Cyanobacteria bacterium SIG31]|nr:type II secretion system protein [Cyanobacteria bacterium SIG31]
MRRLNGFSLAEVLITLTIIGVIASLTLPTLNLNIQKQQMAPILAKSINNLESANRMLLQESHSRNLAQACGIAVGDLTVDSYLTCMQGKNIMLLSNNSDTFTFSTHDLAEDIADLTCYDTNDRMSFCSTDVPQVADAVEGLPNQYYGKYLEMFVDVNGASNKPNIIGKDVFLVHVDLKGSIMPYGGSATQKYLEQESPLWESECSSTTVTDGKACAGNIADNGWKIEYSF